MASSLSDDTLWANAQALDSSKTSNRFFMELDVVVAYRYGHARFHKIFSVSISIDMAIYYG
jgi:hypothetical protein